jgi:hypothetical protein
MAELDQEISHTGADIKLLYEVSTSIHSILDLDEMLQKVLRKISRY